MNDFLTRVTREGADKLALRFPSGTLKGAGAALAAAMNEEGFLLSPGGAGGSSARPWRFESLAEEGESVLLLGPAFTGRSPDEAGGAADGMPLLLAAARALASALSLPRGIVSSGILVSETGEVLVLPPSAVAKALSARGPAAADSVAAGLSSPKAASPEDEASFLLAQAAYRYAAGKPAFLREASDAGRVAASARRSAPAALAAPRLDPELSSLIDAALEDPKSASLAAWVGALEAAGARGWERELPPDTVADTARRLAAFEAASAKRRRRSAFLRKRGGIMIAAAVALTVVALIAGDMLRAQRDKPNYSALAPLELVGRYYAAIEGLDLESLEACGDKKAIKPDWNLVMNLGVITKTRMAYEGKNPVLHAKDWTAAGKPPLAETDFLYGIVGLSIEEESPAVPERPKYWASYSFWSLDRVEDPSGNPSKASSVPKEERRVDEISLERVEKGGWRIAALERKVLP